MVAEAVALASEEAAAEAAEAVLVTAAAVAEAAARASESAVSARRARAEAAEAAAQSVAHQAARSAARVQLSADLAAEQVQEAAALAAEELAHAIAASIAHGTPLDTGRMAELLAATVSAAAHAAAQDTTRAASAVADATDAAAAHVTQTVAAADDAAESEVTATADTQRNLATATAAAMAAETDARAVGVAVAARKAAVALSNDQDDAGTADPRAHPAVAEAMPSGAVAVHQQESDAIVAAAEARDSRAEIRDRAAAERERTEGPPLWHAAVLDRGDSQDDRVAAASDRAGLRGYAAPGLDTGHASATASLSEMAAQASHDLLVPLSSIIASVELLGDELSGHPDPVVATLLGRAVRAGDRMVQMVHENMTSRIVANSSKAPMTDLAAIARQFAADSADLLHGAGAVVEIGELPMLHAYPGEMYSVLQNLITNSVKFARPGVPAIVQVSAQRSDGGWRVTVRDNGCGLPSDVGLDVFSLYSRGTSAVPGHGIGLATVARIIATSGGQVGTVAAKSGAEIWFELPDDEPVRRQTP